MLLDLFCKNKIIKTLNNILIIINFNIFYNRRKVILYSKKYYTKFKFLKYV